MPRRLRLGLHALRRVGVGLALLAAAPARGAEAPAPAAPRDADSPPPHPERVYWGDPHLHSGWSVDAAVWGATLGPEDALRFARGERVTSSHGQPAQLSRPLDWVALTDHAESMATLFDVRAGDPAWMEDPVLKRWRAMLEAGRGARVKRELGSALLSGGLPEVLRDPDRPLAVWRRATAIADAFYRPGEFTTLIGFEWTSNAGGGDNLHRNVIFRDGRDRADAMRPLSSFDSNNPEVLWNWMARWEEKTGGRVLAIPHNGNLSNGRMFAPTTFAGAAPSRQWAAARARFEPLYEITQIKGDGETHPALSPRDEFADYETWDEGNMTGSPKARDMLEREYARQATVRGLALERELGTNPFKIGFVGGTDAHTGLSTADEDDFFGKHSRLEPSAERWKRQVVGRVPGWRMAASGYTGVWATANTREAIWDALARREAYATTGPRITVRFFGGYDFGPEDAGAGGVAAAGYARGVPMGDDLAADPGGRAPVFLVAALKDPESGNLDRIQIVKGWIEAGGKPRERVFDVTWSGGRQPGEDGALPPVGSTVDPAAASWTDTIGAATLTGVWRDPDFDPALPALYYARVLEIPTPRWTAYDAVRFGVSLPDDVPLTTRERAYTSPIWYVPGG